MKDEFIKDELHYAGNIYKGTDHLGRLCRELATGVSCPTVNSLRPMKTV